MHLPRAGLGERAWRRGGGAPSRRWRGRRAVHLLEVGAPAPGRVGRGAGGARHVGSGPRQGGGRWRRAGHSENAPSQQCGQTGITGCLADLVIVPPPLLGSDARARRWRGRGAHRKACHGPRLLIGQGAHLGSKEGGGRAERRARARPREGRAEGGLGAVPAATDRGRFLDRAKQRVCRPRRGPLGRSVCRSFSTRTHKPDARGRAARAARKRAARGPRPGSVRGECDNKLGSGGGRRSGGRTRRRRKPQPRKMIRVVSASGFRHRRHRKVASSRACAAAAARARRGRDGPAACLCAPPLVGLPLLEGVEPRPASWYLRPRSIGAVGHSGSLQSGSEAELKGVVICLRLVGRGGRARAMGLRR